MFSPLGLFRSLVCPEKDKCTRVPCIFSHRDDLPPPHALDLTIHLPEVPTQARPCIAPTTHQPQPQQRLSLTPAKRPLPHTPLGNDSTVAAEPPRKLQKVGSAQRPLAIPSASHTETGVPILRVLPAQSLVPIPIRQTMLKTLYDHFVILYKPIAPKNPALASEHALRQEEEVYKKSNKMSYRNAVINCVAALKRRRPPDSVSHTSVGTEDDIFARAEAQKLLVSLRVSRLKIEQLVHSIAELEKWGYIVNPPSGPGGDQPSLEGKVSKCERCAQPFQVKRMEKADQCVYHWGKPYTSRVNGEKTRIYTCCSRPVSDSEGCAHGPHVFYESKAEDLHARHPFSSLRPPGSTEVLDVVAMDCEMIYTTGGMRVARVSAVDGSGVQVFDQLVRMDEGVQVIDYNTRFSGITEESYKGAILSLAKIRESLNSLIDTDTILIGHALDNDLKTLRIIHHKCVDTALLFPHRAGPPYRRSLKDLVREKLGKMIQTGDASVGHSSLEDASSTLDLVRWYILNEQNPTARMTD